MYMVIFLYGSMVMRSVMEEKMNRIVEVMISSVKPFQLMLGKLIGVGFVAITQLLIWIGLIIVIFFVMSKTMTVDPATAADMSGEAGKLVQDASSGDFMTNFLTEVKASAMGDDLGEGQQLMMPIFIPVIIALSMVAPVMNNPNGSVAVFGSMFPLFSPILMPARLPFDPPMWQVLLSIVILIASVAQSRYSHVWKEGIV